MSKDTLNRNTESELEKFNELMNEAAKCAVATPEPKKSA